MSILLIEKRRQICNILQLHNEDIEVYGGDYSKSPETIVQDIKNRYANKIDIYMLDVNLFVGNTQLSENIGVRLLKLLRLNHINNHVVLYSWLSRDMLMADIHNAIIFSNGVSFYRLPEFTEIVSDLNFDKLSSIQADEKELRQLFRSEYDPNERHYNANMYGVWQLVKAQEMYEKLCGNTSSIKNDFKDIAQSMETYHALLVKYLNDTKYELSAGQFSKELLVSNKIIVDNIKQNYSKRLQYIHSNIEELQDDLHENLPQSGDQEAEEKYKRKEFLLERFKKEEHRYQDYYERCKAGNIINDNVMLSFEPDEEGCFDIRELLRKANPRIIYVDDMAEQGWSAILQRIVYGKESSNFQVIIPSKEETSKDIADRIWEASRYKTNQKPADLIILDIRLKNEQGYVLPSKLSGFEVMSCLGQKTLCPILMFTASNKIWSMKKAFKGNAVSFWIKGGVDNYDEDIAHNYFDLIKQIWSLCSANWIFRIIAELRKTAKEIQDPNRHFWWESYETGFPYDSKANIQKEKVVKITYFNRKLTSKNKVVDLLTKTAANVLYELRQLYFFTAPPDLSNVCSLMVIQLSYILDEIHRSKEVNASGIEMFALQHRMLKHLPERPEQQKIIKELCAVRNRATHRGADTFFDERTVVGFVNYLKKYLIQDMTFGTKIAEVEGCCPIEDRLKAMNNGETIKVTIVQINEAKNGKYIEFVIDKSGDVNKTSYVFVDKRIGDYYKLGEVVSIKKVLAQSSGLFLYYAIVPQLTPIEERKQKLDNGEVVFVEIMEMVSDKDTVKIGFSIKGESDNEMIIFAELNKTIPVYNTIYQFAKVGDILSVRRIGALQQLHPFGLCPKP